MNVRSSPACGTTVDSIPFGVPTQASVTSGSAARKASAVATMGEMCPAVPPPARMMLTTPTS